MDSVDRLYQLVLVLRFSILEYGNSLVVPEFLLLHVLRDDRALVIRSYKKVNSFFSKL